MPAKRPPSRRYVDSVTNPALLGPSIEKTGVFLPGQINQPVVADEPSSGDEPDRPPRALRIERAGSPPLIVPLYPDQTYVFGRAPESSFVFSSEAVSRLHAELRYVESGWLFRDLNSTNGSHLVDGPIDPSRDPRRGAKLIGAGKNHEVLPGQTILLGEPGSRLTFLEDQPGERPSAARRAKQPSLATERLEGRINVCARHRLPVFLLGPSGCGKTFVARAIHERARMEGQFVLLNCGRLPHDPAALTSELLGHVKGAFTGAVSERKGKLWCANLGTLFLDEVESLPRSAQDFLLDVLEGSGSYAPYGASGAFAEEPPRFRLISASKTPLAESGLRPDLCQRLAVGEVLVLPRLAERRQDIPDFVETFLLRLRSDQQIDAELTPEAVKFLQEADWEGGELRELESTVRVVVAQAHACQQIAGTRPQKLVVGVEPVDSYLEQRRRGFGQPTALPVREPSVTLPPRKRPADLTAADLRDALARARGNKTRAAELLGVALNTLKAKLRRMELESPTATD